MKASQKFKIQVENLKFIVRFDELDPVLLPLIAELEKKGDRFGPVVRLVDQPGGGLCVAVQYADKTRDPTKPTLFGQDADEFMAQQHK